MKRVHVDLFSGIGGFALAARWNGIETVQFVEVDQRCRDFLSKAWPGVAIHDDVRTFHHDGRPVFLLTGGVPCQPASRAGKQRGDQDDRWLWPEAVRLLGEIKPRWALFENPPGIGDVGLAGILSNMEAQGYEVQVVGIPACSVGSPQIRMRYWIVAHSSETGREGSERAGSFRQPGASAHGAASECAQSILADRSNEMHGKRGEAKRQIPEHGDGTTWRRFVWLPCADGKVRRAPDDSFGLVDGLHRSVLGALGNSIVPQVASEIIRAILMSEEADQ